MKKLDTGLSGCKLELTQPNIVRKYSSSKEYNERLEMQINKQKLFSNLIFKNIQSPKIFNVNYDEIYYFDMEYVSGYSFQEYFSISSIHDVDFILDSLFGYFDYLISTKKIYKQEISKKKIINKVESLESKTNFPKDLLFLKKIVEKKPIIIPQTFCHGDLTFANVLFHPNRLYFIDFLDCFIDSFLSDLVKLKQDLYYGWSLKIQNIKNLKIQQTYSYIWREIEKKYSHYIHTIEFDVLDFLNTLRLDPYLTDNSQRTIIVEMLRNSNLHLYENTNCPDGRAFE